MSATFKQLKQEWRDLELDGINLIVLDNPILNTEGKADLEYCVWTVNLYGRKEKAKNKKQKRNTNFHWRSADRQSSRPFSPAPPRNGRRWPGKKVRSCPRGITEEKREVEVDKIGKNQNNKRHQDKQKAE